MGASSSSTRHRVPLVRLAKDDNIYNQNNRNIQPRVGFAWDPFKNGKTSVRGAYAVLWTSR